MSSIWRFRHYLSAGYVVRIIGRLLLPSAIYTLPTRQKYKEAVINDGNKPAVEKLYEQLKF